MLVVSVTVVAPVTTIVAFMVTVSFASVQIVTESRTLGQLVENVCGVH